MKIVVNRKTLDSYVASMQMYCCAGVMTMLVACCADSEPQLGTLRYARSKGMNDAEAQEYVAVFNAGNRGAASKVNYAPKVKEEPKEPGFLPGIFGSIVDQKLDTAFESDREKQIDSDTRRVEKGLPPQHFPSEGSLQRAREHESDTRRLDEFEFSR